MSGKRYSQKLDAFLDRWIGGHLHIGPLVIYGRNAMHYAINIRLRGGWLCLKPPTWCFGRWWKAYLYWSPDATPMHKRAWGYRPID